MMTMISILYVDDEPDFLEIANLFLERTGEFTIRTCTSATEALSLLQGSTFDMVISDYQMPEMNGITFLKETRMVAGQIPFILFTGHGSEDVAIKARDNGADYYLQKRGDPVARFTELTDQIHQIIDCRRTEDEDLKRNDEMEQFFSLVHDLFPIAGRDGTLGPRVDDLGDEARSNPLHQAGDRRASCGGSKNDARS
jgi:DNA-binding NtrC family response regulator